MGGIVDRVSSYNISSIRRGSDQQCNEGIIIITMHHPNSQQHPSKTPADMDQVSADIITKTAQDTMRKIATQRVKRGECPTCRRRTHKVSRFPFPKREPLTIYAEVENGRCLKCQPSSGVGGGVQQRQGNHPGCNGAAQFIPDSFVIEADDDDMTVASEITMDPYLRMIPNMPSSSRNLDYFESVSEDSPVSYFQRTHAMGHNDERRRRGEDDFVHTQNTSNSSSSTPRQENKYHPKGGGGYASKSSAMMSNEESFHAQSALNSSSRDCERILSYHHQNPKFHDLAKNHEISLTSLDTTIDGDGAIDQLRGMSPVSERSEFIDGQNSHVSSTSSRHSKRHSHPMMSNGENSPRRSSLDSNTSDCEAVLSYHHHNPKFHASAKNHEISLTSLDTTIDGSDNIKQPRESGMTPSITSASELALKKPQHHQIREDTNRFSLKRLSANDALSSSSSQASHEDRTKSRTDNDPNRSASPDYQRKKGTEKEPNRFSLNQLDHGNGKQQPRRQKRNMSLNDALRQSLKLEEEVSQLDSSDILRDAAAEANGEDPFFDFDYSHNTDIMYSTGIGHSLDSSGGEKDLAPHTQCSKDIYGEGGDDDGMVRPNRKQLSKNSGTTADTTQSASQSDEVDNMYAHLSKHVTEDDKATIMTAIAERQSSFKHSPGKSDKEKKFANHSASIKDIPVILKCVKLHPTPKCTERAFHTLFLLATDPDPNGSLARREILVNFGMEANNTAMWSHMYDSKVLLALLHTLWAITVFGENDEDNSKISLARFQECGAFDSLLFAMQTHSQDLEILEAGCDLISWMARVLPHEQPGLKSAIFLLSSKMRNIDANTKAYNAGLLALNSLCQLSDENKREFAKCDPECHSDICNVLTSAFMTLETRELACELYWCVTSDRTAVSNLVFITQSIIDAMMSLPDKRTYSNFHEAACGTLANLALDPMNHVNMMDIGVLPVICKSIYSFKFSEDIHSACCTALANLSATKAIRAEIISQDGITALFTSMRSAPNNEDVQSEAVRALQNLCETSLEGKKFIASHLEIIINAIYRHEECTNIRQMACSVLCKLSAEEVCRKKMILSARTFDVLAKIMKLNLPKRSIQKTGCLFLRNLSMESSIHPILLNRGFVSITLSAMSVHANVEELQKNACHVLWNLGSHSSQATVEICSGAGIQCIVKAMQNFPDSILLQQATCGALWAVTRDSDSYKNIAISAGTIDAIVCLILVHPHDVGVLESALKFLASLSSVKKCAKEVANASGIDVVVEAMRSNSSSIELIRNGSLFIQNMAFADSGYADQAVQGITSILHCMDEHPDCVRLVEDSCRALRCLVLHSKECKDRVLTANGVGVIEKVMNENFNVSTVQECTHLLLDELLQ